MPHDAVNGPPAVPRPCPLCGAKECADGSACHICGEQRLAPADAGFNRGRAVRLILLGLGAAPGVAVLAAFAGSFVGEILWSLTGKEFQIELFVLSGLLGLAFAVCLTVWLIWSYSEDTPRAIVRNGRRFVLVAMWLSVALFVIELIHLLMYPFDVSGQ